MPENFISRDNTLGRWATNNPDDFDYTGDDEGYWPVSRLRQQYLDYLQAKMPEIEEQKLSRHYYHGAQFTPDQIDVLRRRRQPIITFNRVGRKIDGIVGLVQRLRQDPKAFPTSPRNAAGAEIATQCVRSVLTAGQWEFLDPWCAGQALIEGVAGVELKLIKGDHDDPDIGMDFVFGDDFFYDPRSAKPDYSDSRYMGIAKWLDVEEAVEMFPDHEYELRTLLVETGFDLTTHSDREFKWIYVNEKRLRLVEHWYQHRGQWYWSFYCSNILLAQGVSPFKDERHVPMCRFIMFSDGVDHDGDRYGKIRNMKGAQDELNQRRSKALHISNVTRVTLEKGAVDDVETTRREMARPDGVVEFNKGFQKPEEADQSADLQAHLSLMQDSRNEIESYANMGPGVLSQANPDEHSGVALNLLQRAGIAELGPFLRNYKQWKLRVYRAIWNMCRQHWTAERFIRVSEAENVVLQTMQGQQAPEPEFIQLNGREMDEQGREVIINAVGSLNVEIRLDDGPDVANIMQDAYEVLKQDPSVPWQVKVFFAPIPDSMKKQVMMLVQQPPNPMQQQAAQLELMRTQAEIEDKRASAAERRGRAVTDSARAAHLASQANLNQQDVLRRGLEVISGGPMGGGPQAGPPPRTGASAGLAGAGQGGPSAWGPPARVAGPPSRVPMPPRRPLRPALVGAMMPPRTRVA